MILYEYPFNERIRTYLRLEHLFRRLGELVPRAPCAGPPLRAGHDLRDHGRGGARRPEVRRAEGPRKAQARSFNSYRGNPSISEAALDQVVAQLERNFTTLNTQPGKAGHSLTENEWLMSIRSRVGIPGGTCEFDLPAYYAWQHHAAGTAPAGLERWASTLAPLAESIYLLLKLLRDSDVP